KVDIRWNERRVQANRGFQLPLATGCIATTAVKSSQVDAPLGAVGVVALYVDVLAGYAVENDSRLGAQLLRRNGREDADGFDAHRPQRIGKRRPRELRSQRQRSASKRLQGAKPDEAVWIAKRARQRVEGGGVRRRVDLRERCGAGHGRLSGVV